MSTDVNRESEQLRQAKRLYAEFWERLDWQPEKKLQAIAELLKEDGHEGEFRLLNSNFKNNEIAFDFILQSLIPLCYMRTAYDAHTDFKGYPAAGFYEEYCASEKAMGNPEPTKEEFVEFLYQRSGYPDPRNTYEKGLGKLFNELPQKTEEMEEEFYRRSVFNTLPYRYSFSFSKEHVDEQTFLKEVEKLTELLRQEIQEGKVGAGLLGIDANQESRSIILVTYDPDYKDPLQDIVKQFIVQVKEKYYPDPDYIRRDVAGIEHDDSLDNETIRFIAGKFYARINSGRTNQPEEEYEIMQRLLNRIGEEGNFHLLDSSLPKDGELAREYIEESLIPFCHLQMARNLHFSIDAAEKNLEWLVGSSSASTEEINDAKEKAEHHYERSRLSDPIGYEDGLAVLLEQVCDMPLDELKEIYDKRSQHGLSLRSQPRRDAQSWASAVATPNKVEFMSLADRDTGVGAESQGELTSYYKEELCTIKLNKEAVGSRAELKELSQKLMVVLKQKGINEPVVEVPLNRDGSYTILVTILHSDSDKMQEAFDHFVRVAKQDQERQRGLGR